MDPVCSDDIGYESTSSFDSDSSDDESVRSLSNSALVSQPIDLTTLNASHRSLSVDAQSLMTCEALLRAASTTCCYRNCIVKLSPNSSVGDMSAGVKAIRAMRLPLVQRSNSEQYDYLKHKLEGSVSFGSFCLLSFE